MPDQRVARS